MSWREKLKAAATLHSKQYNNMEDAFHGFKAGAQWAHDHPMPDIEASLEATWYVAKRRFNEKMAADMGITPEQLEELCAEKESKEDKGTP